MQRHLAILFILALSLSMAAGCGALVAGGAAAAGTYVYTEGRLQQQYDANLDQAFQASLAGARDAGLKVTEQNKEVAEASIRAEQQDGSPVWITLESLDQNKTQVSVRVGYTGDEQASRRIQEAIAKRF
ncbi:DUF3568 domain-containing protein [Desulfocurvibacter africanus]|uniref:DUF3568 family protein n=1 Tax=Desulfocurvibacter africanus subsp. africanus str. Walvis Bay TaxID=690850 RepID=F3YU51_DESAF|nr:DUF3568 domain-containing protein [Desulfocurvibacter africanus]EGJ48657.1 hypothetical protein Desaf_0300 [Desulfocurvibacter africanus subsp. africanus str. Walvis Bay]